MDIPKPNQEIATSSESVVRNGAEVSPIAEVVSPSPSPIVAPVTDDIVAAPAPIADPLITATVSNEELVDLTSSAVEQADDNWVGKVRELIKEDEGKPFQEEADAEELNEAYMKTRFNIDVDAPVEEK